MGDPFFRIILIGNRIEKRTEVPDSVTDEEVEGFVIKMNKSMTGADVLYYPISTDTDQNAKIIADMVADKYFQLVEDAQQDSDFSDTNTEN